MNIYAISDEHLSFHSGLEKPMDIFGESWENHAENLKKNWEEIVSDEDYVLMPGDISWGLKLEEAIPDLEWIHNLPGHKIISKGNHDLWWGRIKYINTLYDDITFLQNTCYYIKEKNIAITATRGWPYPGFDNSDEHDEKIYKRELQRLKLGLDSAVKQEPNAKIVVALHYPPSDESGKKTEFTTMLEEYGVKKCVYGHLHGSLAFSLGIKGNVRGVEYSLVSLDYLGTKPKLIY